MMVESPDRKAGADLLTSQQVAERLAVSVRTLWRLVASGKFPQPVRYNRNLVRWKNVDALLPHDQVKLVLSSRRDYEWARDLRRGRLSSVPTMALRLAPPAEPRASHRSRSGIPRQPPASPQSRSAPPQRRMRLPRTPLASRALRMPSAAP